MRTRAINGLVSVIALIVLVTLAVPASAAFPGANGKIAFHANRDGNFEIYTMNPDGSAPTRLTNNGAVDITPAWSPDGSKIAFVHNGEIYVMNADGSGQTNLTNPAYGDCPAWSPDGSKIAVYSGGVYVINADGSGLTNLPDTGGGCTPAWSPDGSKIAFPRDVGACCGRVDIYVTNADGSGQESPLITSPLHDSYPDWSPDGSQIAFDSDQASLFSRDIYVMNADGSGQPIRLTDNPGGQESQPAWAPDGSKIAFGSDRDGNAEVYAMNANGTGQVNLTMNAADDSAPDWQPLPPDTTPPLNHFQCYETDRPPLNRAGVSLVDAFGPSTVTVKRAKRLCAPADKNGEDPTAPTDPEHLTFYTINQTGPRFAKVRGVSVENQFGTNLMDVVKPDRLLVPTAKSLVGTPAALASPIDHFKCYRVARARLRVRGLAIVDQFGATQVNIKRPLHLCLAAEKDGEPIIDASTSLACYQVTGRPPATRPPRVFTLNQFGPDAFEISGPRDLCVPSTVSIP